jgi:hypothetical protein
MRRTESWGGQNHGGIELGRGRVDGWRFVEAFCQKEFARANQLNFKQRLSCAERRCARNISRSA